MRTMSIALMCLFVLVSTSYADETKPQDNNETQTTIVAPEPTTMAAPTVGPIPAVPPTPATVEKVVYARRFTLSKAYKHLWRKEQPQVTSGYLLVLKVDPKLVYARQCAEPVLYVGDQTAERVNVGYRSGYVVAIVPGDVDLKKAMIWFGTPELPERVDGKTIMGEAAKAKAAKVKPHADKDVKAAIKRGGKALNVADREGLLRQAAELIKQYSPVEVQRAEAIVPVGSTPE